MMRREGRLVEWYADRGFGFLAPDDGGPNVFLHIKSLPKTDKRLDIGQAYVFDAVLDSNGRERAENAVPIVEPVVVEKRPAASYLRHLPPFLVIAAFIGIGLVTFLLGLLVMLPLIGHATWHAYRDTLGHQQMNRQ